MQSSQELGIRVGTGFDLHPLRAGRPCVLGGVAIVCEKGPLGHSDGDALLHAIADAILGAAGLEDLGTLFSDKDPRWKDADSRDLTLEAVRRVHAAGWRIVNVDAVLIAEIPRIAPHRKAICESVAKILDLSPSCVNVKGKTAEGFGPIGAGEAIAASAVALLARK